jgi:acetolactate synthase-1/2/3 large subunit
LIDENGRPVAAGEPGELVVRSRYISEGYWHRPDETAAAFQHDPEDPEQRAYRTGDLGRILSDGSLVFLGRRDHQVKIRGYRVEMWEVEATLLELDEVVEATVVVRQRDEGNQLVALVVMRPGARFDPAALRERLKARLPEWKIPSLFQSVPELPTTLTGKVDRQLLARRDTEARTAAAAAGAAAAPLHGLEQKLTGLWKESLHLDAVGPDDHFLDLGGDSIGALMILNRVEQITGIRFRPATFFRNATIRQLAALISECTPAAVATRPSPSPGRLPIDNTADWYVQLLNEYGVEYIFINPGTDTAPILESLAKFKAGGHRTPALALCTHESVAMAAAHGYYMVTGRPQVVMVHVDVGTQNLGANLHNAQRGRAGVVICAGRAPYTLDGSIPGGRTRYNHWVQEQSSQANIVRDYVKWQYELTHGENLPLAVQRAFQLAGAEPAGPVYLVLPREVLMQPVETMARGAKRLPPPSTPAADPGTVSRAAAWLIEAGSPLILVSYAGRNPKAVAALVRLAETLAAPVVESRYRVNFPVRHPLHLGFSGIRHVPQADCILVIDQDVPWIPAHSRPASNCRVIQVDIDPLKRDIPIWGFPVDLAIQADSSLACVALAEEVERQLGPADRARIETRRRSLTAEHPVRLELRSRQAAAQLASRKPIAPEWAAYCLNEILDEDTIVVSEAVSNNPVLWNYLELNTPGTYFQSGGSGLGWGLGAALGAKLAAPSKTVICATGDGSWIFSSPITAYWAAERQRAPFLTVIFNNQEYFSTAEAILAAAPEGYARKTGNFPACDLPAPGMYSRLAEAMNLWAQTVDDPAELPKALHRGLDEVRRGRCALVNICVASSRPDATEDDRHR